MNSNLTLSRSVRGRWGWREPEPLGHVPASRVLGRKEIYADTFHSDAGLCHLLRPGLARPRFERSIAAVRALPEPERRTPVRHGVLRLACQHRAELEFGTTERQQRSDLQPKVAAARLPWE